MTEVAAPMQPRLRRLETLWRGHVFLFDKPPGLPTYGSAAGVRLLLLVAGLELVHLAFSHDTLLAGVNAYALLGIPLPPFWFQAPILLALALLSVRFVAGLQWPEIGLHRFGEWNATETSYFIQVVFVAGVVFPMMFAHRLRMVFAQSSAASILWTTFVPYMFWGFHQEVLYRGMLQTELVRRWGAVVGIIVANALYTFGPQHFYYFFSARSLAASQFASIYAIGLVFAMVFRRSGNLWLVGVMHAIGNSIIAGTFGAIR